MTTPTAHASISRPSYHPLVVQGCALLLLLLDFFDDDEEEDAIRPTTSSGAAYASDPHLVDSSGSAVSIIRDKPKSVSFIRGFVRSTEGDGNVEGVSKMSVGGGE